jgi:hypothetical protein
LKTIQTLRAAAAAALIGLGMAAVPAGAATYTVDDYLFSASINSGDATETQTLENFLGIDLTLDDKVITTSALKDDAGHWYFDIAPDAPGYFLVKFGVGNTGYDDHYYFENIGELTKLVFTNDQVNGLIGTGDTAIRLSHYVTFTSSGGGMSSSGGGVPSLWPMSMSSFCESGLKAKRSTLVVSGSHCWWKRGASTASWMFMP